MSKVPPPVTDNPDEGVFQMKAFPYASYDEWRLVYRKAAADANSALELKKGGDGKEWSLVDLLDDTPLRSAYAHHLDPTPLGTYFGMTFNIEEIEFADGKKTRDFSPANGTGKGKTLFGIKHPVLKAVIYGGFIILSGGIGVIVVALALIADYRRAKRNTANF